MGTAPDAWRVASTDPSHSSVALHRSLQTANVHGRGSERFAMLSFRHGARWQAKRPRKRASGWSRCKNAVTPSNFNLVTCGLIVVNLEASAALANACTEEAATTKTKRGKVRTMGIQSTLRVASARRTTPNRC